MPVSNNIRFIGETAIYQKNNPTPSFDSKGGMVCDVLYDLAEIGGAVLNAMKNFTIGAACQYIDLQNRTVTLPNLRLRSLSCDNKFPYPTITCSYGGRDTASASNDYTNSYNEKTVVKTLTMSAEFDPPQVWTGGRLITGASRTITYTTQEAASEFYTQTQPSSVKGKAPGLQKTKIKSSSTTVNYTDGSGDDKTMVVTSALPTGVVAKLTPTGPELVETGLTSERVTGTSWWRGSGIKSYEFVDPNT